MKRPRLLKRRKQALDSPSLPNKITNENIEEHREEILGSARKFIYPLKHTKKRLVSISLSILSVAVVAFFLYSTVALYKFQDTSMFMYRVSQVVPFPVAKAGNDFVAYENYLFEINHYVHYYKSQQQLDFNGDAGQAQLKEFKKRALEKVINDAYIRELAKQRGISVSNQEVNEQIAIVRDQNRLGSSDKEFKTVLKDFWGWSVDDFKRSLKQQILAEKVLSSLDTGAHERANQAYDNLVAGADFEKLAKKVSEDPSTKTQGGEYGFMIDKSNRDISASVIKALFDLKPSQYSKPIEAGYGLEIVKNIEEKNGKIKASHIVFNFKNINDYLGDIKDQNPTRTYIRP